MKGTFKIGFIKLQLCLLLLVLSSFSETFVVPTLNPPLSKKKKIKEKIKGTLKR